MKNYDPNLGSKTEERRRFRLFLLIMLPVAGGLGYLVALNPPDPPKPQTHEQRASFAEAAREIWSAIRIAYSTDFSSDDTPGQPRHNK